ncbi:MAG: hypothetical protein U0031_20865 [Thermomicrobiales bacterium]
MSGFVDTIIFERLVVRDDVDMARRCSELLQQGERGEIELVTSEAVVAATVYVRSSPRHYGISRKEIVNRLGAVLSNNRLRLPAKEITLQALELFGNSTFSFVDCLCVMHSLGAEPPHRLYSFDRSLARVPALRRLEP